MKLDRELERAVRKFPPLHQAAWRGQPDRVLQALGKGADPNEPDPVGYTPLSSAAAGDSLETVQVLLAHGADPNLPGAGGNTPLMTAVSFCRVELVRLLLEHGADPNAVGFRGCTPLLRVQCAEPEDRAYANTRIRETAEALVQAGADVRQADERGRTPLLHFVGLEAPEVVRLLIDRGADVNARDRDGKTPLLAARFDAGGEELVELLLASGAAATNADGFSLVARRNAPPEEVWNAHWAAILEDPFERRFALVGPGHRFLDQWLEPLRRREFRRVLLPGNGCSLLPHALAHCGFAVTVLDFSTVANAAVSGRQPDPEVLAPFLPAFVRDRKRNTGERAYDAERSRDRVQQEGRSGGAVHFITADVLAWEAEPAFDCIYDVRLAQILPRESWPELARRYRAALVSGGLCVVETLNLCGTQPGQEAIRELEAAFAAAGFQPFDPVRQRPATGPEIRFLHGSG